MKSCLSRSLLIAGLLLGVAAAACGGGGDGGAVELSLEQYFERVASLTADLEERTASLDQQLEQEFESDVAEIEAVRDAFATVLPIFGDFIDDLDELNPPEEVADLHGELVAGFADLVDGFEDLIDQLVNIESAAEFSALLFDPDSGFGSAIEQLEAVCLELQSIADDNGIEADLLDCAE